MKFTIQRRLAAEILKTSPSKIRFDTGRLEEIKECITKMDIRNLIKDKAITALQKVGTSRVRARKIQTQKAKGKQKGQGSRKGRASARLPSKTVWMNHIRKQRELLKELRDRKLVTTDIYRDLYLKSKGGFFRSVRHIKMYIGEKGLVKK